MKITRRQLRRIILNEMTISRTFKSKEFLEGELLAKQKEMATTQNTVDSGHRAPDDPYYMALGDYIEKMEAALIAGKYPVTINTLQPFS